MNKYLIFFALMLLSDVSNAQSYNTAFGIRLGDDYGLTLQQRILNHTTIEAYHQDGLFSEVRRSVVMIKQHKPLISRRFNFFVGAGVYRAEYASIGDSPRPVENGAALTFGTELTIGRLNIAVDVSPTYHVSKSTSAHFDSTSGLSMRYVLWKRKSNFSKALKKLKFW